MPIKLDDANKLAEQRFKRAGVKEMVLYHRNKMPAKKLHSAHFELTEVLTLLRDNGLIDFTKPLDDQLADFKRFGVKLYPGIHSKPETCPGRGDYMYHSNIIMCTTEVDTRGRYIDMLTDKKDSVSMAGFGLDFAHICPPDCGIMDDVAT